MSQLESILEALHPLAGKLVHFDMHLNNEIELPAAVVAVGVMATAETNLEGVREGERVVVTLKDGEPEATATRHVPVGTSVVLSCAQIQHIHSLHSRECGCVAFHSVWASYAFMDSEAHART
jgi:hypothetical protein